MPAPIFVSDPTVESPIYDKCGILALFLISDFLISTKFPIRTESYIVESGLILANGPISQLFLIIVPSR